MKKASTFPQCPTNLPEDIKALARSLAKAWATSKIWPRPSDDIISYWDSLIDYWIDSSNLSLFIRKSGGLRGEQLIHKSGRKLIITDNSPAHWMYFLACSGQKLTIEDIRHQLDADSIPIAWILENSEKNKLTYKCALNKTDFIALNKSGWKVAHIESIGIKKKDDLRSMPIDILTDHFRKFLYPSNMFLVPKIWAGLGELPEMAEAIKGNL